MKSQSDFSIRPALLIGTAFGVINIAAMFLLSGYLDVKYGRPAGSRCDVIFQSDAGQRINDSVTGKSSFGMGSHALMTVAWPKSLRAINSCFSDPERAAPITCRAAAAVGLGLGWGFLSFTLIRSGVPPTRLMLLLPMALFATSNVVACLPDHFAWSVGALTASFAAYRLTQSGCWRFYRGALLLAGLAIVAGGICLTNALFPIILLGRLYADSYRVSKTWQWCIVLSALLAFTISVVIVDRFGDHLPLAWQAKRWLNFRIVHEPISAMIYFIRGFIDPVIGPVPTIDSNNFFQMPMLTYEPAEAVYSFGSRDLFNIIAVCCWIALIIRSRHSDAIVPLVVWVVWNGLFHNIWGDEYFLYSPHTGWALIAIVMTRPLAKYDAVLLVPLIAAQVLSLIAIRSAIESIVI